MDFKLTKFLKNNGIKNIEEVKKIHLFGIWWEKGLIVHHSVDNFDDFYDYVNEINYQRIMVVFKNGGSVSWDIDPDFLREGLDNIEYNNIVKEPMSISSLVN